MIATQRLAAASLTLSGIWAASFLLMKCVIALELLAGSLTAGF